MRAALAVPGVVLTATATRGTTPKPPPTRAEDQPATIALSSRHGTPVRLDLPRTLSGEVRVAQGTPATSPLDPEGATLTVAPAVIATPVSG